MKQIYETIANRIKEQVPELAWIDLDNGQLDYAEYRSTVDFPAALISINYLQCNNIGITGKQQCQANIMIRLITQVFDDTNLSAPIDVRNRGLAIYDLANKLQAALQWWRPNDHKMGIISRKSLIKEKRDDGLAVIAITYECTVLDTEHCHVNYLDTSFDPIVSL